MSEIGRKLDEASELIMKAYRSDALDYDDLLLDAKRAVDEVKRLLQKL